MNGNLLSIRKEISWEKEEIKIGRTFRLETAPCQHSRQGAVSVNRLPLKDVLSSKLNCIVCYVTFFSRNLCCHDRGKFTVNRNMKSCVCS